LDVFPSSAHIAGIAADGAGSDAMTPFLHAAAVGVGILRAVGQALAVILIAHNATTARNAIRRRSTVSPVKTDGCDASGVHPFHAAVLRNEFFRCTENSIC
jgi:hypothetical protein